MIRLSIPARQVVSKLTLPVLIAASFALLLVGKADTMLADRARVALLDSLAPVYVVLSQPLSRVRAAVNDVVSLWNIRADNAQLRAENDRLRQWQSTALALDAENRRLKAELHWVPDPATAYVTARVVADAGGIYAKAVLLAVGPNHFIRRGEIALDENGLVGRVTDVGARTARVLLITDLNSRIPVMLEQSRGRAILAGTNGPTPRLLYLVRRQPPTRRRTRGHVSRSRCLPGRTAHRHRPLQRHQRAGGCPRRQPGPPRDDPHLRLRAASRGAT